ncbi:MAG: peptidase, partial [Candidatus Aminicenantes bacterium]|nr:peptidase [Candidatus Aminicenantes bacterium]
QEVVDELLTFTFKAPVRSGLEGEIQRVVNYVTLYNLMGLGGSAQSALQVKAVTLLKLQGLKSWLQGQIPKTKDTNHKAHFVFAIAQIELFQEDPAEFQLPQSLSAPPGAPIGN